MTKLRIEILIAIAVSAMLVVASVAGAPEALGAHPWWAKQTGIIDGASGVLIWLAMLRSRLPFSRQIIIAGIVLLASAAAAHFGKQVFVASFAENALAGRFWYFGWFALSGSAALLIAATVALILRR